MNISKNNDRFLQYPPHLPLGTLRSYTVTVTGTDLGNTYVDKITITLDSHI